MKLTLSIAAAFAAAALAGPAVAGPGEDLAAKYQGQAGAADKIFLQLKNGGKVGDEDDHKKVVASDADIKALVQLVLSAK